MKLRGAGGGRVPYFSTASVEWGMGATDDRELSIELPCGILVPTLEMKKSLASL